mgnify:FL=1
MLQEEIKSLPKIENMTNSNGNKTPNQFIITTPDYVVFQSYSSIIAVQHRRTMKIVLDRQKWDYSITTGKYRNQFTGLDKKQTIKAIESGEIELSDLN